MSAGDDKPKPTAVPATPAMVRRARARLGRPGAEVAAGVGALVALTIGASTCSDETIATPMPPMPYSSSGDIPPMIPPMPDSSSSGGGGSGGATPDAGDDAGDAGDASLIPPMPALLPPPTPPKT